MAQSKTDKQIHWYGVDEQTVRWLALIVLAVVGLVAAGGAYRQWEVRTLERRTAETLERAGGMLSAVREEGGSGARRSAFNEASLALDDARLAWNGGDFRAALSEAEISLGLLVTILDSIRNPGGGEARFIYVEGVVDLRRGETGTFRLARPRDVLYEGDYVRSSSRGSAEILFGRDGSLFTVRPDTLLKINRTQRRGALPQSVGVRYGWVDLSTSTEESEIETEFVQTTVANDSEASVALDRQSSEGRFTVGRGGARLATDLSDDVVQLADRQQITHSGESFGAQLQLPLPPEIQGPQDDFDVNLDRRREVALTWAPVAEATGGYSLQVSRSRLFADNLIEVDGRLSSSARLGISDEGAFYWRVASIDARGERSSWSETRRFRVLSTGGIYWEDQEAPALELEDIYVNGNIVIVTGRTEPGVNLHVAGQPVPVNAEGSFLRPVSVSGVGLAGLVATAVDAAGNQTVEYREVFIDEAL